METVHNQLVLLEVNIRNDKYDGLCVARVNLPGGLELEPDCLANLVATSKVDLFEREGADVLLYWNKTSVLTSVILRTVAR
mmetsp:Transcript_10123/g.8881  ORF Transcript_10123/g.8881 Transcript_10123/m.8881 type:complete len:81 (+) Transcript_10123:519-761(+)